MRDIGVGMYGVVVLAFDSLIGEYVAIKIMHRGRGLSKITEREIFSHRTCSAHPHVIAFQQVFLTRRYAWCCCVVLCGMMFVWLYMTHPNTYTHTGLFVL